MAAVFNSEAPGQSFHHAFIDLSEACFGRVLLDKISANSLMNRTPLHFLLDDAALKELSLG